jgi:hypothetical protein
MPVPVKVSDRLLSLAKEEGRGTHRSATAQIEHWATLGRAVEAMLAYHEVLALKRTGAALPIPRFVTREDVHAALAGLLASDDRNGVREHIRAAAGDGPVYEADPADPDRVVEVRPARRVVARKRKPSRSR